MSISERKAKEKLELKSLILQSAMKLFIEKGIEQTTIRSIAQSIDYSVGTVYLHFKDKNDILHELHSQGFKQFTDKLRVLMNVEDPMERLIALGRSYLQFAIENQDMYELMFTLKAPIECINSLNNQEWNEGKGAFEALKATVNDCIENGHFKGYSVESLSFAIWSSVHGMCSLYISKRFVGVSSTDPDQIIKSAFESLHKLLRNIN